MRPEECGCLVDGSVYVAVGEYYFRRDCTEFCRCVQGADGQAESQCGAATCHDKARCSRLESVQQCVCLAGYVGNGIVCNDVDECRQGSARCRAGQSCTNTIGSYSCGCEAGFRAGRGGAGCEDVDECAELARPCGDGLARCSNGAGSYDCACPRGHRMSGGRQSGLAGGTRKWDIRCEDEDECRTGRGNCDLTTSECVNTIGSFVCRCRPGYISVGTVCKSEDLIDEMMGQGV